MTDSDRTEIQDSRLADGLVNPARQIAEVFATQEQTPRQLPGALPTNRAPGNCTVYRYGVDSLYLSFGGVLHDAWAVLLEQARNDAQSPDESIQAKAQVSILDHLFQVKSGGSKLYRYTLADGCFHIQLSRRRSGSQVPVAYVQLRSQFLTSVGVEQAVRQLRLVLSSMADLSGEPNVSRVDLFADYSSPCPLDSWTRDAWISRAHYIGTHFVQGVPSGWSIGGGDLQARLYDKVLELQKSGKDYLRVLWAAAGWTPDRPVHRLEFQVRNTPLKELGIRDFSSLMTGQGGLWRYMTEDWLRLAVPNPADDTKSRWPTHPLWVELSAFPWADQEAAERAPLRKDQAPSVDALCRSLFAVLTSYMAVSSLTDPIEAGHRLLDDCEAYFDRYGIETGIPFDARTHARAARKAVQFCLPYPINAPISADQAQETGRRAYRKATGRD